MKPQLHFKDDLTVPPPGLLSVQNTVEISITGRCNLSCRYCFYADETIEAFGVGKRRLRLDSIQFSIDGSCAQVHDASRPPKSFDRALRGLRLMKVRVFPLAVRVTVNRYNLHDLENIARLLPEDVGLASFGTNEADRFGSAKCYGQDVMPTPEERLLAMVSRSKSSRSHYPCLQSLQIRSSATRCP